MTRTLIRWSIGTALLAAVGCQQTGGGAAVPASPRLPAPVRAATASRPTPSAKVSSAADDLPERPTLADYLAYAALNNQGLEAAFNRWKAALERAPQVRSLPDPRFTYRYFIEQVETRVGPQRQAAELSQTFPWFGKLKLAGYAAMEAAGAERQRYQAEKLKLFYQVKDAYYEYYYLWQAIGIVKENIRLVQNIERVLHARYKAAAASHSDLIRVQVELGKLDDHRRTLVDLRAPIVARLNAALNRNPGAPLPWPKAVVELSASMSEEEMLAWLKCTNPEVRALDFEVDKTLHEIKLAKKQYYPDVTLGVSYIDTDKLTGGMSPSDNGKDPIIAGVSLNLPIWRRKLDAGVREARYRHWAAVRQKAEKVNTLSAALKLAAYRFRDADRKIGLYRDTLLPKARESLKATQTAFQAGKATYTDLIDAERILLDFQLAYKRAIADKAQRLGELEMLTGREIECLGNPVAKPPVRRDGNSAKGTEKRI